MWSVGPEVGATALFGPESIWSDSSPDLYGFLGMIIGTMLLAGGHELIALALWPRSLRGQDPPGGAPDVATFPDEYADYRRRVPQIAPGLQLLWCTTVSQRHDNRTRHARASTPVQERKDDLPRLACYGFGIACDRRLSISTRTRSKCGRTRGSKSPIRLVLRRRRWPWRARGPLAARLAGAAYPVGAASFERMTPVASVVQIRANVSTTFASSPSRSSSKPGITRRGTPNVG